MNISFSGNWLLNSWPSIFPYTALTLLVFEISSMTAVFPISPACYSYSRHLTKANNSKVLLHISQFSSCPLAWAFLWAEKLLRVWNLLGHSVHENGLSFVWNLIWMSRFPFWWNPFPQWGHVNFFSLSWIGLCFFKPDVVNQFLEHILSSCDLLFGFHALLNGILKLLFMQTLYYSRNIETVWPLYGMCYAS